MNRPIPTTIKATLSAAAVTTLAACGSVLQVAEIEGSGYSDGSGSGFGSVYVNGTRFATGTSTIVVDGQAATEAALEVGMQLQVDGDVLAGVAQRIRYDRDLSGPIDAINRANLLSDDATLTVLGQAVEVDSRTRYIGTALSSLSTDNSIEVSGLRQANGRLRATFVRLRSSLHTPGTEQVDVEGVVTAVNGAIVTIGSLQIDLAGTALAGQAGIGDRIEAFGQQASRAGTLVANRADFAPNERGNAGPQVQLEGFVTDVSGNVLRINGLQVDTANANRGDGSSLPITTGARVIVNGTQSGSAIDASRLVLLPAADIEITGAISGIDLTNDQITVLGQTIQLQAHTQYIDDSAANLRRFRIADLALGDRVELLTYATGNPGTLAVARLTRLQPTGNVTLQGLATDVDTANEQLRLGGVLVSPAPTTIFSDADGNLETVGQFFANIGDGTLVNVVGAADGAGGLTAERMTRP